MIEFRPITIDDRDWMSEKLREDNRQGCEYSFANNFIWSVIYKVEVAEVCGCCVIKFDAEGEDCYASVSYTHLEIGREAARRLIDAIEKPRTTLIERVVIEGTLITGQSVGELPENNIQKDDE